VYAKTKQTNSNSNNNSSNINSNSNSSAEDSTPKCAQNKFVAQVVRLCLLHTLPLDYKMHFVVHFVLVVCYFTVQKQHHNTYHKEAPAPP
jgi:hypothetical protein